MTWPGCSARSAYAAEAASRGAQPQSEALRQWTESLSTAYLGAYRQAIVGCPSYPKNAEAADKFLTLFLLDKAFYEVAYELANRPDWVEIPLKGVVELLD